MDTKKLDAKISKNLKGEYYKDYDEIENEIVIDEDSHINKDEITKRLIDRHVCSICAGIVKLPAVLCLSCSSVVCL